MSFLGGINGFAGLNRAQALSEAARLSSRLQGTSARFAHAYDPTGLFQDRAGTIPVSAYEDVIGLAVDKSQHRGKTTAQFIAEQPELNPTPAASYDKLDGVSYLTIASGLTLVEGDYYQIQFSVTDHTAGQPGLRLGGEQTGSILTSTGNYAFSCIIRAGATAEDALLEIAGGLGVLTVSNVSIKHVGHCFVAPLDSARPRWKWRPHTGWAGFAAAMAGQDPLALEAVGVPAGSDATIDSSSQDGYESSAGTTASRAYANFTTTAGRFYRVRMAWDCTGGGAPTIYPRNGWSGGGASLSTVSVPLAGSGAASVDFIFHADSTTSSLLWVAGGTSASAVDMQITGLEIQEVPASVPLVHFFENSSGKNLQGLDYSVGGSKVMTCMAVRPTEFGSTSVLFELSPASYANSGSFAGFIDTGGTLSFRTYGTVATVAVSTEKLAAGEDAVVSFRGDTENDINTIDLDGVEVASNSGDQGGGDYATYDLNIGSRSGGSVYPFIGEYMCFIQVPGDDPATEVLMQSVARLAMEGAL